MADIPHPLRTQLYPEIDPYAAGRLKVDALHTLYWEQSGNPEGEPVLFLHGGPGAGASPAHRRFWIRGLDGVRRVPCRAVVAGSHSGCALVLLTASGDRFPLYAHTSTQ